MAAMTPESPRDEPFELTFDLTEAQRAELREAMAEIDRGEYVEEDVLLRDLGIPR
jgi:predicted transcriptional regulator